MPDTTVAAVSCHTYQGMHLAQYDRYSFGVLLKANTVEALVPVRSVIYTTG